MEGERGMKSYVILEGVDGGGKSTLSTEIADEFGVEVVKVGPPEGAQTELGRYLRLIRDSGESSDAKVCFDRLHLGSYAYCKTFRQASDVDGIGDLYRLDWQHIEDELSERAVLVLCDPGFEQVRMEWGERQRRAWEENTDVPYKEYEADIDVLEEVHRHFWEAYHLSTLPKMHYDWTNGGAWQELHGFIWEHLGWSAEVPV